jgi:hypothetical protein
VETVFGILVLDSAAMFSITAYGFSYFHFKVVLFGFGFMIQKKLRKETVQYPLRYVAIYALLYCFCVAKYSISDTRNTDFASVFFVDSLPDYAIWYSYTIKYGEY